MQCVKQDSPFMFEEINSYTELLFLQPLQEGSVTELVTTIPNLIGKRLRL